METSEKKNWISSFSRLSLVANLGSIIGLAVGFVWTSALPLEAFLLFCAGATGVAIVLSYYRIPEPAVPLETDQLSFHPSGYLSRIYQGMTFVLTTSCSHRPRPRTSCGPCRATRAGAMTGRALLFLSTFLFTTSSAFLNTSFTPFLSESGVIDNEVFAVSLINIMIQTGVYRWMGDIINRFGGVRLGPTPSWSARRSTWSSQPRPSSSAGPRSSWWPRSSTGSSASRTPSGTHRPRSPSSRTSARRGRGTSSAATPRWAPSAPSSGSLFTGYISYYQGYSTTFTTAAAVMLVSFFVLEASLKSFGYTKRRSKDAEPTSRAR